MVDSALVVFLGTFNVFPCRSIVELSCGKMRYVSESIPLCARLGVQYVPVVICNTGRQWLNLMLELLAAKSRLLRYVEWEVEGNDLAGLYFF